MSIPKCVAILGPTCCWKSEVGLRLAELLGGDIISCDSMQIYRMLDIGTAKASLEERRRVPHHLIDELELSEPYDASRFVNKAKTVLTELEKRGRTGVLVGGTGLYARALIYGFNMLPADPEVFARIDAISCEAGGCDRLYEQLSIAAAAAGSSVPEECRLNRRRLVRSVEVLELTGKLPWLLKSRNEVPDSSFLQFCIVPELNMVKERIRRRTAVMLEAGWIEEAAAAAEAGLLETPTARQALGYQDIIGYLRNGLRGGEAELAEILANKTIQYARRQLTWFKHQHPGAVMLSPSQCEGAADWIFGQIRDTLGI